MLVADILEAIGKQDVLYNPISVVETHSWNSRTTFFKQNIILSSDHWRDLTEYLHQDCAAKAVFALELAAKARCRSTVGNLDTSNRSRRCVTNLGRTIFADLGARGLPWHPEHADRMLRDTGRFMATLSPGGGQGHIHTSSMVATWSRAMKLAQDEHAEISTRQAAIDSLAEYYKRIKDQTTVTNPPLEDVNLFLVLYDSLLDDDEDVRDSGAAAVYKLLTSVAPENEGEDVPIPLMVPAARHQLLKSLQTQCRNSSILWTEAMRRVIGIALPQLPNYSLDHLRQWLHLTSPRTLLENLKPDDTALFVEEKQNLYIDEAQEAGIWADVLLSLDQTAIQIDILRQVKKWSVEGLCALIEVAKKEIDGPLGWSSKPEVFSLGVRILHAARAVIRFSEDQTLGADGDALRGQLERLLLVGEEGSLNPAWLRIVRMILHY
ncbi:MAG: hypothetical protein Q9166_003045 [cf. Caloplaca sp. 2 TL-2023]